MYLRSSVCLSSSLHFSCSQNVLVLSLSLVLDEFCLQDRNKLPRNVSTNCMLGSVFLIDLMGYPNLSYVRNSIFKLLLICICVCKPLLPFR